MRTRTTKFAAIASALALTLAACGDDGSDDAAASDTIAADEATTDDSTEAPIGTIVDVAVDRRLFTTLVAAVQAAGLVETLSGDGPFTVFAPTDDAFAAALDALGLTADELLADTDTLTSILTYHVRRRRSRRRRRRSASTASPPRPSTAPRSRSASSTATS